MSKKDVRATNNLYKLLDKNVIRILDNIDYLSIFKYDINKTRELLNTAFVELYINKDKNKTNELLKEAEMYLNENIIEFILDDTLVYELVSWMIKEEGKKKDFNIISDEILIYLAKNFSHYNQNKLSLLISKLQVNSVKKCEELVKYKIMNEQEVLYNEYINLLNLYIYLQDNIDNNEINNGVNINDAVKKYNKVFNFKDLERLVKENGYKLKNVEGSHYHYVNDEGNKITIPHHKEIKKGTSYAIQKRLINN